MATALYTPFLAAWLAGFTVCLSLIVSIGAQNLYVLRQAVHSQHVRACVAWCVASDALLIGLGVAGMARLLAERPDWAYWLGLGGVLFMLAYGLFALWRMALPRTACRRVRGMPAQPVARGGYAGRDHLVQPPCLSGHGAAGGLHRCAPGRRPEMGVRGRCGQCQRAVVCRPVGGGRRLKHWFAQPLAWRILDGLTGAMMLSLAWWVWQGWTAAWPDRASTRFEA
jgi:L-lysine exporter family protein LysE/ArgO